MRLLNKRQSIFAFLALFIFSSINANAQKATEHYHLLNKVSLGGEGGWDYISFDDSGRRLYISHATHVIVYDVDNAKVVGDISNTEGVHGIAFAPEFNHGFTSNGKSNSVLMFDLNTLDTLKRILVGQKPDAIIYDPFSKMIIVCNGKSENATLIDASTGNVKASIPLGGGPEFAVSDLMGHAYINIEDKNEVVDLDMKKFKVLHHWNLGGGEGPTGIDMDRKNHRLFIGCANKLMVVVNSENGKIISKLPIGIGVDAVIFDPKKSVALSSNGDGTLTVVREHTPNKFEVEENIVTQAGARTEALDQKTGTLYFISADFGPAPEATKDHPHPRPSILPNTFTLLKFGY